MNVILTYLVGEPAEPHSGSVLLPSVMLVVIQLSGIKRILVGLLGVRVCTRFRENQHSWDDLKAAVIEFDPDPRVDFLVLKLFRKSQDKEPVLVLDVSRSRCVVRARRHFLKNIVTHIDTVCYVSRAAIKTRGGVAGDGLQPQAEEIAPPQLPPKAG